MRKRTLGGQVLPIVMAAMLVLVIIIVGLVSWTQRNTTWAVKNQKTVTAVNFAEAGVDRATWKLQSSTFTWTQAAAGVVLPGYHFDTTFSDVPGGQYRIKLSSGPGSAQVTVLAEGRDNSTKETRAISVIYKNQTIYSAMMSGGNVTWAKGLGVYWGPIISQGDITLVDDTVASLYFPRKYAKGVVVGTAANPRDTNGLLPPNTDNVEWWSGYPGVPNVPILDFAALRSSAAATGTLNIYGCQGTGAAWDLGTCPLGAPHTNHFGDSASYINTFLDPTKDYVWYWDGDVTLTGSFCGGQPCNPVGHSTALRGTIVVRGNLTIDTPGDFVYTGHVPTNAWQQHTKLTKTTFDSGASQEYPADIGLNNSATTWNFGTDTFCQPTTSQCGLYATVGIRGFTYIGGNLNIISYMDFNGAIWVNGTVTATGGSSTQYCGIFYDDTLSVPALNVILLRQSWQEVAASPTAWP